MGFDDCFRCVPPSSWLHLLPTLPHSVTQPQLGPPLSGHFLQDNELSQLGSESTLFWPILSKVGPVSLRRGSGCGQLLKS